MHSTREGGAVKWTSSKLTSLGLKLAALQYKLPFNDYSADLVERLFHDLMKSVETNKKLMIEVRTIKEKNIKVESTLRNVLIQREGKPGDVTEANQLESRIFRLSRVVESILFITSKLADVGTCEPWSGASLNLLNLLMSYEKALNEGGDEKRSTEEFPAFLKEFHSVWKAQEERDFFSAQLQDKEREFASLILLEQRAVTADTNELLAQALAEHREKLFRNQAETDYKLLAKVEQLRDAVQRKLQTGNMKGATSILEELHKQQEKIKELETLKQEQSEMILRLEKKLAAFLKKEKKDKADCSKDTLVFAEPVHICGVQSSSSNKSLELEALEIAKDAWRTERQILESARDQMELELQSMKVQLTETKQELDLTTRRMARILADTDRTKDELAFSKNRISFFEKAEIERQISQSTADKQMREMERSNMEMQSLLADKSRSLEEYATKLNDMGRALIAQDAQIENGTKENHNLLEKLQIAQDHLVNSNNEYRKLEYNCNTIIDKYKACEERLLEYERRYEEAHDEIKKLKDQRTMTESNENETRHLSAAYRQLTDSVRVLEQQLRKVSGEKQAYKEALLEAREQWRLSRDQFSSLQSRYRTLLTEMETKQAEKEGHIAQYDISSSLPQSLRSGTRHDQEEELQQLQEYISTLQKELNVFRKSRDSAIEQRQIAMDRLKKSEGLRMQVESQLRAVKAATELLQKRLKNYVHRCDLLDSIVSKQRNHILGHDIPMLDHVQFDGSLVSVIDIPSTLTGDSDASKPFASSARASGRSNTSLHPHSSDWTRDNSSSNFREDPSQQEPNQSLKLTREESSRTSAASLPSSPRTLHGNVSFNCVPTKLLRIPRTLPMTFSPQCGTSPTPYPICMRSAEFGTSFQNWNGVISTRRSNDSNAPSKMSVSSNFRPTCPQVSEITDVNEDAAVLQDCSDWPSSKSKGSFPTPPSSEPHSLLWISDDTSAVNTQLLIAERHSTIVHSDEETPTQRAWSAGPSSLNITERTSGERNRYKDGLTLSNTPLERVHHWPEKLQEVKERPGSADDNSPSSSCMSLSMEDIERSAPSDRKGCSIRYTDNEESILSYSVSEAQQPISTQRFYTDSATNGDRSSVFRLSESSE